MKAKYVIFDCDGVLVDSEAISNRVEAELKTELGVPITFEEQTATFCGLSEHSPLMREHLAQLPSNYLDLVNARLGPAYRQELKPIAGVIETLECLRQPHCVASSSGPDGLDLKLSLTDLKRFFAGAVFHGQMVSRYKPDPDLFLYAAQSMGWKPEDCLVVEDSVYGVQAGVAAGMRVCGFLGGSHLAAGHEAKLRQAGASFVITDPRALLQLGVEQSL